MTEHQAKTLDILRDQRLLLSEAIDAVNSTRIHVHPVSSGALDVALAKASEALAAAAKLLIEDIHAHVAEGVLG